MNRNGIALASVLFALVSVLVLTSVVFFSLFVDLLAASNASAGEEALYAAEAGIARLWARLEPDEGFSREAAWSAGEPPFGSVVWFPEPPRTYRVRVSEVAGSRMTVTSEGTSHRGARRRVEAAFRRDSSFRPGATLMLGEGGTISEQAGAIDVQGVATDRQRSALGAVTRAEVEWLRSIPRAGRIAVIGPSGLPAAANRLAVAPGITFTGMVAPGAWGDETAGALVHVVGAAEIVGESSVSGIVLVDGPLRIDGRLEVDGLLLARASLDVAGELVVHGAAFLSADLRVRASGRVTVIDSAAGLDIADGAAEHRLPRSARLAAWRELW